MEKIRKVTMMSVRRCYRLVCNHPFLLGFLFFLFLLYRSFPLLFSLLVSASPVLVCTALLLGTLLSFGEPRLPEIEKDEEERVSREMSPLKTGGLGSSTVVVSRDEGSATTAERFMGDKRDLIERAIERVVCSNNEARMLGKEEGSLESAPLIHDDRSLEARGEEEKGELREVDRNEEEEDEEEDEVSGRDLGGGEVGEHHYRLIEEAEDDVPADSGELKREPVDADVGSSVGSEVNSADKEENEDEEDGEDGHEDDHEEEEEGEEEEEEDDDDDESLCSGSGSDHAESSSPDASMADILPMLDELHPLLDGEEPLLMNMSRNGSNVASEHSHKSEDGNVSSDDGSENTEGEDGENDEEEEEDEDEEDGAESEVGGGKGDESKAAISWTEDDQKNLMDLGTSELERNQRLENLIARRRARRLMAERNLIDFDGSDLPFNVPAITTTRRNPFDGPDDSYSNMGLPPIPGSAPSILLPRRNPFDLPYEANEEKPDLKEDGFQQEFVPSPPTQPPPYQNQPRDNFFFRRHESFSVGPSSLGFSRQERQDLRWKPFFVPEHFGSEGTNFQSFERQSSGMSDSKASSVPDTESVTSTVDQEDKTVNEQEEFVHETEEMSNVDRASLLVEHGSATSEDLDHQEIDEEEEKRNTRHDEVEITLGEAEAETESQHDIGSSLSEEGVGTHSSASPLDVDRNGFEVETELLETGAEAEEEEEEDEDEENINSSGSGSSPSSFFSEVDEKILEVKKEREEASSSQINYTDEELESHVEDVEFSFMTGHHKDPVYDSSPPAAEKYLSCSSDSSDLPGSELLGVDLQNENIAGNTDVTEMGEDNFHQDGPESEEVLANQNGASMVPESVNGQVSNVSSSASSGIDSVGNDLVNDSFLHHEHRSIEHEPSNLSSLTTELGMDIEEHFQSEQAKIDGPVHEKSLDHIVESNHDLVQNEQAREAEMDTHVQSQDTVQRSDTPASSHWHMLSDLSDGMSHGEQPFIPEDRSAPLEEVSEMAGEQLGSDSRPSFDEISEEPEPPVVLEESASAALGGDPEETHDDAGQDSVVVSTLTSESPSFASESSNYESPTIGPDSRDLTAGGPEFGMLRRQVSEYYDVSMDEASDEEGDDEIKGIDDGFLTELDTVGDFRVEETGNESHRPEFVLEEESKGGHSESELLNQSGSTSALPVLEPRSLEDITMAFRQLQEGADVEEVILPSSIDNDVKVPEGTQSGLPVVEARSLDDIHVVKQIVEENAGEMLENTDVKSRDVEDSVLEGTNDIDESKGSNDATQGSSSLPVLEVRSVEDVTMTFKQLDEGAEVEEVILPSSIKDQQDSKISEGTSSGLPIVEARSLDDIHNIVTRVVEENVEEVPKETDGKAHGMEESVSKGTGDIDELRDSKSSTQGSSNLPVLEVRSVEDVTTAFKQLDEGAEVEEVILPSSIKDQQELSSSDGTNSGLPVVEARSLDDIHNMVKQVMEESHEEVPKEIVESKDRSVEAEVTQEAKEVNSSEAIVSEPKVQETTAVSLGAENAEVSASKSPNSSKKKVRSRNSSSGSSSSSSSSSSDSD